LLQKWTEKTIYTLRYEKWKLNVDDTFALDKSLKGRAAVAGQNKLVATIEFLVRGRFQDMGAGRKRNIESVAGNREMITRKGRVPKKWYSPAFYGRINSLQGAIGFKFMEEGVRAAIPPFDESP